MASPEREDNHKFEYRHIMHVKSTTSLEESNEDFDASVIEKYRQMDAGTYVKPGGVRIPGTHDLRHDPAKLHADVKAVLEEQESKPAENPVPVAPVAVEPTAGVTAWNTAPGEIANGDLKAVPRKGGAWYDVVDSSGQKVNKTPIRKKEALAFVDEANRGTPTE